MRSAGAPAHPAGHERPRAPANPRDGYLDRFVHRRLSWALTRLLLGTPLTPNAVTVAGVALGVAGGALIGAPGPAALLAGVVCLVTSGVLDCADGELARLRRSESRLGHWLDIVGDTLVHTAFLAGIAVRTARAGSHPGWPLLLLLGLGVLGAFAAITLSEQPERRRREIGTWEDRILDGVLSPLTTRDWYVFPVALALAGRLEWLVPAAAVGAHLFWIAVVVLLVRVSRAEGRPVPGARAPH
jgi:phosphatidylglycerophosphate synthase